MGSVSWKREVSRRSGEQGKGVENSLKMDPSLPASELLVALV